MNVKTIKLLIAFFAGLILLFLAFMVLNHSDSPVPAQAPGFSATAAAQRILAEAAAGVRENTPPSYRAGLSTESISSEGAIMLVKSGEFEGVAEDPQSMLDTLSEMSGSGRKKISPVSLTDKDLDRVVAVAGSGFPAGAPGVSAVPELGSSGMGAKTMITAPVDYQFFTSSETWSAFASSHKGHFPEADFSKERMVILVSVSELPSGIFKIAGVNKTAKEAVVLYRVDPLAMSAESGAKEQDFYAAAAIPKKLDVRLEQVP